MDLGEALLQREISESEKQKSPTKPYFYSKGNLGSNPHLIHLPETLTFVVSFYKVTPLKLQKYPNKPSFYTPENDQSKSTEAGKVKVEPGTSHKTNQTKPRDCLSERKPAQHLITRKKPAVVSYIILNLTKYIPV